MALPETSILPTKMYHEYIGPDHHTVLITGASRGIGQAIFTSLHGMYNVISPRRDEMNLADPKSVREFIEKYQKAPIDIIINNAGINYPSPLERIDETQLREMIEVNQISPLELIRGFLYHMKSQRWGRIVNISSIAGFVGRNERDVYTMTKHAINGLTRSLALQLGPHNILVNSVCPGFVETDLTKRNVQGKLREKLMEGVPLGRFAEPEEIAQVVAFLISEKNTYMTGQLVVVDGGFTAQ